MVPTPKAKPKVGVNFLAVTCYMTAHYFVRVGVNAALERYNWSL